eukprot:919417-Rhodomonas_salina.8
MPGTEAAHRTIRPGTERPFGSKTGPGLYKRDAYDVCKSLVLPPEVGHLRVLKTLDVDYGALQVPPKEVQIYSCAAKEGGGGNEKLLSIPCPLVTTMGKLLRICVRCGLCWYGFAMRCAVLTWAMLLPGGSFRGRIQERVRSTIRYVSTGHCTGHRLCCYACTVHSLVLTWAMLLPGSQVPEAIRRSEVALSSMALPISCTRFCTYLPTTRRCICYARFCTDLGMILPGKPASSRWISTDSSRYAPSPSAYAMILRYAPKHRVCRCIP